MGLRTHQFYAVWKHALLVSILKPGEDPALLLPYFPLSLLENFGKLFQNILLNRILYELIEGGLMREEKSFDLGIIRP